jgi:hypothetical protein
MNDETVDQADEEDHLLSYEVSDEALEPRLTATRPSPRGAAASRSREDHRHRRATTQRIRHVR